MKISIYSDETTISSSWSVLMTYYTHQYTVRSRAADLAAEKLTEKIPNDSKDQIVRTHLIIVSVPLSLQVCNQSGF